MRPRKPLYISYAGPTLLETPLLNKGSAFDERERIAFNLLGLLPPRYESIEEQTERAYAQYCSFELPINKHIYLRAVQDNNETLFFRLLSKYLVEMLPVIYTPTVGDACEHFSEIYRRARGLFVAYSEREHMSDILQSVTKDKVRVIVVTDGERVLGLGDQGIGGMGISIGKLSLYTACGGISPAYTLPVALDVGTDNPQLLADPLYMGMRHPRVRGEEYLSFVDRFIAAATERWPGVLIQFEDFAQPNAMPLLQRYRDKLCCFNDDIQGTAAVCVGTLLAACRKKGERLRDQRIVILGAGSAGCGIAESIIAAMTAEGLDAAEARTQLFMVDRFGLLTQGMPGLMDFQQRLAQEPGVLTGWQASEELPWPSLLDVVRHAGAGVLLGVSGKPGLFTEEVIRTLHASCPRPIVMQAHPAKALEWTQGQALVATGSPFGKVEYDGREYVIAQCNNSYIFPGIGLGVLATKASRVTDEMLMAASMTLAQSAPVSDDNTASLLPPLTDLPQLSRRIAFEVGRVAQWQGHALEMPDEVLQETIEGMFWEPESRAR